MLLNQAVNRSRRSRGRCSHEFLAAVPLPYHLVPIVKRPKRMTRGALPDRSDFQRLTNPYAPPATQSASKPEAITNRLLFIWIWLPTTILGAMLAAPADLFSILPAMAFALPCYLCGVFWASRLNSTHRWLLIATCALIAIALAIPVWLRTIPSLAVIAFVFMVVNIVLGVKSCWAIPWSRRRVFGTLSIAYILGLLLGPIGVVILCVPSVLIADRTAKPEVG